MAEVSQKIRIQWRSAKEPLSVYFHQLHLRNYDEIRQRAESIIPVSALIYDLGHIERGYQDFPDVVELSDVVVGPIARKDYEKGDFVCVTLPEPRFVGQIVEQIKQYLHQFVGREGHSYAPRCIVALEVIAERMPERPISLIFDAWSSKEFYRFDSFGNKTPSRPKGRDID